jgi:hypothetical protein
MANIYDVNAAIQQPNIVGAFQQGVQTARSNAAGNIALQQAQQGQQDTATLRSLAPSVIAGDPAAYAQAAAINPDQANAYQGAGNAQLTRLNGAINFIDQQKTPEAKESAYQNAVRPYLAQIGAASGKVPPATFAEAEPMMEAARAQIAQLNLQQTQGKNLINVGAGGAVFDPNTMKPVYSNASKPQLVTGPNGVQYWANPGGEATPVRIGGGTQPTIGGPGGQAVTPTSPVVPNAAAIANSVLARGGTQEQAVAAANAAGGGLGKIALAVDPATGQFRDVSDGSAQFPGAGAGAPNVSVPGAFLTTGPKEQFTQLSPDEVKAAGLPAGTVAQRGTDGKISVVSKGGADAGSITAPGDPTKTGDEYLATIPPSMARLVKAIADGDQAPPSASSRSPEAQALLQAVYAYDPSASASNLPTRTATRKSFTSGKDAQNMTALSQLALHLDHLNDQVEGTSGLAIPFVGGLVNRGINAATDPTTGAVTQFDSSANAVAHELRAVFANAGGGTQAELEQNLKELSSSASTPQKRAAIQNIAQLVHGRFGILQDKYSQGMGRTEDPFATSYPGAESTILKLSGGTANQPQTTAQPTQSAPSAPGASPAGWSISRVQ